MVQLTSFVHNVSFSRNTYPSGKSCDQAGWITVIHSVDVASFSTGFLFFQQGIPYCNVVQNCGIYEMEESNSYYWCDRDIQTQETSFNMFYFLITECSKSLCHKHWLRSSALSSQTGNRSCCVCREEHASQLDIDVVHFVTHLKCFIWIRENRIRNLQEFSELERNFEVKVSFTYWTEIDELWGLFRDFSVLVMFFLVVRGE